MQAAHDDQANIRGEVAADSTLSEPRRADPRNVPLDLLCAEVVAQELRATRGEPSDDDAGLELFRRAIDDRNDEAWRAVVAIYRGMLRAQAGRRVLRGMVVENDNYFIDRAFERFWQASLTSRFNYHQTDNLGSILK